MPYFLSFLLPVGSFSLVLPLWAGLCATFTPLSGTCSLRWPSGLTHPPLIFSCNISLASFCCWGERKHLWRSAPSLEVTAFTDNAVQVDGGTSAHHRWWPRSAPKCTRPRECAGDIPELPSHQCIAPSSPRRGDWAVPSGPAWRGQPGRLLPLLPALLFAPRPGGRSISARPGALPGCRALRCRTSLPRGTSGPAPAPRRQLSSDLLLLLLLLLLLPAGSSRKHITPQPRRARRAPLFPSRRMGREGCYTASPTSRCLSGTAPQVAEGRAGAARLGCAAGRGLSCPIATRKSFPAAAGWGLSHFCTGTGMLSLSMGYGPGRGDEWLG